MVLRRSGLSVLSATAGILTRPPNHDALIVADSHLMEAATPLTRHVSVTPHVTSTGSVLHLLRALAPAL